MKKLLLMATLLSGCITHIGTEATYGPNGYRMYKARCQGPGIFYSSCLASAGKVCGSKGYVILDQRPLDPSTSKRRSMLFECKR